MAPKVTIKERVFSNPLLVSSSGIVTVMLGMATKGEFNKFQLISSIDSFESIYGAANPASFLYFAVKKYLPYSPNVMVARIGDGSETKSSATAYHIESGDNDALVISALSEGTWGDDISVKFTRTNEVNNLYAVEVFVNSGKDSVEKYYNISLNETSADFIELKINGLSKYITVDCLDNAHLALLNQSVTLSLSGGTNGDENISGAGDNVIDGVVAGINALKDKDKYMFDVVIVPETFSSDASIVSALDDLVKVRNDCFSPIDPAMSIGLSSDPITNIVKFSNGDSSCGVDCINLDNKNLALMAFWQKDYDATDKAYKWFPPSIYMAMDIARVEFSTGARWNAIAGLENGRLATSDVQYSPSEPERELLYGVQLNGEIRVVNPIVKFTIEGITLWGQRTTERSDKPTNRINVVLMLNFVKQKLYAIGKKLQFKLNFPGSVMWDEYSKNVNVLLEGVKSNGGCENFTVVEPAATNTPEIRANNKFVGKIKITPTNVAEDIEFVLEVTPAGVTVA